MDLVERTSKYLRNEGFGGWFDHDEDNDHLVTS